MIVDRVANASRYTDLNPVFPQAFSLLASDAPATLPAGVHEFDGFRAIILETAGKGHAGAPLERHEHKIDIHYTVDGLDEIGWRPTDELTAPRAELDTAADIQFFDDEPQLWVPVPPGVFAIQFPGDGHAPLAGEGVIRKVVLKIDDV